ncbi:protein-glutamate methylesterase/protein-glutamine glutaminase [Ferrimonas balearica]|uniref:protein-glutamate methylesterase/protein-glutamine glutaminase n=1 Tax=Ferrimonas balearica TaxID=44012 RepID=UPI001F35DBC4|nr:chemotaxis response regulator protein-glutamate methylesterase [Ferrimonas balearica]MBY6018260.1 chemotaxis response regulator protein-glutamate methylesterase [Halomonas denitrificans]MBY6094600.1 chemotaxis response regulator protein-glutamate methylesterase [Ferrimonas balearica]
MTIKVLVVDDSSFFRRRVAEILGADPELEVIDTAINGQDAVDKVRRLRPDVVTMDIEMPVMDGISAVRALMRERPLPVLMFSSLTYDGARATLEALDAGAADFLPKRFEEIANDRQEASRLLQQRVKAIANKRVRPAAPATPAAPGRPLSSRVGAPVGSAAAPVRSSAKPALGEPNLPGRASGKRYRALLIGTSTGGPVALQTILTQFPADYPYPILLVQHMPAAFTPAFAQRLDSLCKITVKEAQHGDRLQPGTAYLAPGGKQMLVDGSGANSRIVIREGDEQINYKPSVDITFGSATRAFGGDVLGVILTGMGADGREGSRMLKKLGATIWAQDAASCVVYGMPQAVAAEGIASHSIPLNQMAEAILRETHRH